MKKFQLLDQLLFFFFLIAVYYTHNEYSSKKHLQSTQKRSGKKTLKKEIN